MKRIKETINNINKPVNPKVVKLLSLATVLVIFFPQWFNSIPFSIPAVIKETVEWVFKGVDLFLVCWALFGKYEYKGSIYKKDSI